MYSRNTGIADSAAAPAGQKGGTSSAARQWPANDRCISDKWLTSARLQRADAYDSSRENELRGMPPTAVRPMRERSECRSGCFRILQTTWQHEHIASHH